LAAGATLAAADDEGAAELDVDAATALEDAAADEGEVAEDKPEADDAALAAADVAAGAEDDGAADELAVPDDAAPVVAPAPQAASIPTAGAASAAPPTRCNSRRRVKEGWWTTMDTLLLNAAQGRGGEASGVAIRQRVR